MSKCSKTIITPLKSIVKKGCIYTEDIKNMTVNLYSKEHISYYNATKFLNEAYDLSLSRQSTYNFMIMNQKNILLKTKKKYKNTTKKYKGQSTTI